MEGSEDIEPTDIYLSYALVDSYKSVINQEVDKDVIPESYKTCYENMCDPADIEAFLRNEGFSVSMQRRTGEPDVKRTVSMIKNAKVFIGCLSDQYISNNQCSMEFQYAKTSLQKPVIPLVVGEGSFKWNASVIGMLIAGELFIHFKCKEIEADKNAEMLANIRKHIPVDEKIVVSRESVTESAAIEGPPDVFLSYCWNNSQLAEDAKQIDNVNGTIFSDPRLLKTKIAEHGYNVWLDVEQLQSANTKAGLFGQIAHGMKAAKLIVPCISDQYAKSGNCIMEFQFALKSINKPVVPIVVGSGDDWRSTVIGILLSSRDKDPVNLQQINEESEIEKMVSQILLDIDKITGGPPSKQKKRNKLGDKLSDQQSGQSDQRSDPTIKQSPVEEECIVMEPEILIEEDDIFSIIDTRSYDCLSSSSNQISLRAPEPQEIFKIRAPNKGRRVVSHYKNSSYYTATVAEVDIESMTYTVDWDDGDPSGRVQPFDQVAFDQAPELDDIGVCTIIFFPEGKYVDNQNCTRVRYHEGEITAVNRLESGKVTVAVDHSKKEKGWKAITLQHCNSKDIPLEDIRVPPTALDFIQAFL